MTYHPADILKTALFFATKTEHHYCNLTKFAAEIGKTTPEDVLASEFLLTQGLRFTFDVRHPFRALEGALMEILGLAKGTIPLSDEARMNMPENLRYRARDAHNKAKDYLKTSALLTDVYFHFTPSQIMMGAMFAADEGITLWYIASKFSSEDTVMRDRVLSTVAQCAEMLRDVLIASETSKEEKAELKILAKKLNRCRNPEKMDLVGLQKAKREGEETAEDKTTKKRKMEREKVAMEGDSLFGPSLKSKGEDLFGPSLK